MDDTDRRLIALLRENARVPVATLAHLLKVSRGTVQNRIDRLTADGVIGGFTVRSRYSIGPGRISEGRRDGQNKSEYGANDQGNFSPFMCAWRCWRLAPRLVAGEQLGRSEPPTAWINASPARTARSASSS